MSKKLLYFNLALDENDTSLGFAIDWIKTIAKNYDHVDVVTLKKVSNLNFQENIKASRVQIVTKDVGMLDILHTVL